MVKYRSAYSVGNIPPFIKGARGISRLDDKINLDIKEKSIKTIICFVVLLLSLFYSCGKSPSKIPAPELGSINIIAMLDIVPVDSAIVQIDSDTLGLQAIPCQIKDVAAGSHLISVTMEDPASPIDYSSRPEKVIVEKDKTNDIIFALTKFAPHFSLYNLNEENIKLEDLLNKVVFLVFYSHT